MSESNQTRISNFFAGSYRKLVSFVQRKIQDSADRSGEDIVQDVVLNLLNKADVIAPVENLSAYMFKALRNRIIDELRKPKRKVESLEKKIRAESELKLADLIKDLKAGPSETLEQEEKLNRIYKAMLDLPEKQKMVIIETEFKGRTFKELSRELDIPVGTLLANKSRGIKAIRNKLVSQNVKEDNHVLSLV
jgi:RNA polymerase sigma factor (sigma-70 family)